MYTILSQPDLRSNNAKWWAQYVQTTNLKYKLSRFYLQIVGENIWTHALHSTFVHLRLHVYVCMHAYASTRIHNWAYGRVYMYVYTFRYVHMYR